jgi:hypothetical protein
VFDIQKNKGSANSFENVSQRKEHTDGGDNGNKCHEHPSVILPFALRTCHLPFLICRNPKSRFHNPSEIAISSCRAMSPRFDHSEKNLLLLELLIVHNPDHEIKCLVWTV